MIPNGYICSYSGDVVLDQKFIIADNVQLISSYITVGTQGIIVYENANGVAQKFINGYVGTHPIAAIRILSSAVIGGVAVQTTALNLGWSSSGDRILTI